MSRRRLPPTSALDVFIQQGADHGEPISTCVRQEARWLGEYIRTCARRWWVVGSVSAHEARVAPSRRLEARNK